MSTELGSFLRRMLIEKNMTQKELYQKSGVSESLISRLMSGERGKCPSVEVFHKLATGLGISMKTLIEKSGYVVDEYEDTKQLPNSGASISDSGLKRFDYLLRTAEELSSADQDEIEDTLNLLIKQRLARKNAEKQNQ